MESSLAHTLLFLAIFFAIGASLAVSGFYLDFPTGWLGAAGLLGWTFVIRGHWTRIEKESEGEPSPPARALWVQCAGYSLLLGHLILALMITGENLRLGNGNALAIDSWIMIAAALTTDFIFKRDKKTEDERDKEISAKGVRASYRTLIFLIVSLSFFLAFAPPHYKSDLTHFVIGNILIALILSSYLSQLVSRLHSYSRDKAFLSVEENMG